MTNHDSSPGAPKPHQDAPEQDADGPEDKKCHYVPQFLLKKFVPKKRRPKQVLVLDKKAGEITPMFPKDICQVTNLYKTHFLDANLESTGETSLDAETKFLSAIETAASEVVKKIIPQVQNSDSLDLNTDERRRLAVFLRTLPARSLPYHLYATKVAREYEVHEIFEDLLADNSSSADINKAIVFLRNRMVDSLIKIRRETEKLRYHDFEILRISCPRTVFAAGGIPFVLVWGDHGIETWIPINPKIAVSHTKQRGDSVFSPSPTRIRAMNRYMYDLWDETIVQSKEHAEEILQTPRSRIQHSGKTRLYISIPPEKSRAATLGFRR